MVVLGVSGSMYGCFFAEGVESGGNRIWERGDSTVVLVAGGGIVEGALAEAGGEGDQQAVGVTLGLLAAGRRTRTDAAIQRVRLVRSVIVSARSWRVLTGAVARWAAQGLPEAAHSSLS